MESVMTALIWHHEYFSFEMTQQSGENLKPFKRIKGLDRPECHLNNREIDTVDK